MKRLLAVIALGALGVACTKVPTSGGSGDHPWTKPGLLRVAIQSDPKSLNPLLSANTTEGMIARLIFDPLLSADPKGNPVPVLATEVPSFENGGISKDGLTITYHLRHGVTWSDGVPLTSADVKFSWQAIMNPENNVASRHGFDEVRSIDTPNATTVIVRLKERYAPFITEFFAESDNPTEIVPAHLLAAFANVNEVAFNSRPIGSGPFKFSQWMKGDHITLVANDSYFRGKPGLRTIVLHTIPDENTTLAELRTHDIDWMFQPSYATYPALQSIPDIVTRFNDVNGYEGMYINNAHPPLDDVLVRRAIAYAIDKASLLSSLTSGHETLATEDIPSWMWAYNRHVTVYPFDPAKARQLLTSAGWTPGSDGIMAKNGQRLSLVIVTNSSNVTRRKATVLVQSMLHRIGIESQIKSYDAGTLFAPAPVGVLQTGRFDLAVAGWFAGTDPDDASNVMSTNVPPGGYNYDRYRSKTMDALQHVALEHYDRPTRAAAYAHIEELLATDTPHIYFWWDRQAQAINPDLKGFNPNPAVETWNVYQWSI